MNDKEDSAWVFDSLIGFLQGPIWSAPLVTFIEEKSLVFEADIEDNEEYHKLYQDYKNLVDLLLGCFMEDMGITPEQFEHACAINKNTKIPIEFHQNLFEQIWAANEYGIFKRMMIQKNLELQLQALNMIEQKYGLTPASLVYETERSQDDALLMEELIEKEVLREELKEEETITSGDSLQKEHERLTAEYNNERVLLEEALKASTISLEKSKVESKAQTPEVENETEVENEPEVENETEVENEPEDKLNTIKKLETQVAIEKVPREEDPSDDISEEEIKKRQDYLKARRDKLVALKKEARSHRLEMNAARPSTARSVAEATIKGEQELKVPEPLEPSILQIRKALAARLQAEVVRKE